MQDVIKTEIHRPEKIVWEFPHVSFGESWEEQIPSDSTRKLIEKIDFFLRKAQITYEWRDLTDELFQSWFLYYKQNMRTLSHDIIATPDWYHVRAKKLEGAYILTCKDLHGIVVGSCIVIKRNGQWTECFKANDRIDLGGTGNLALGTLIDLMYLKYAFDHNAQKVTSGRSRNAFGFYNTLGYLTFKLKLGYVPVLPYDTKWLMDFPKKNTETTAWFACDACESHQEKQFFLLVYPNEFALENEARIYLSRLGILMQSFQD